MFVSFVIGLTIKYIYVIAFECIDFWPKPSLIWSTWEKNFITKLTLFCISMLRISSLLYALSIFHYYSKVHLVLSSAQPSHQSRQYLTNVQSCYRWFGRETIHPTQKFTSMNVLPVCLPKVVISKNHSSRNEISYNFQPGLDF